MIRMTAGMMWLASALLLAQAPMQAQEYGAPAVPAAGQAKSGYIAAPPAPCAEPAPTDAAVALPAAVSPPPGAPPCNR